MKFKTWRNVADGGLMVIWRRDDAVLFSIWRASEI
jgi:hypothetical protein